MKDFALNWQHAICIVLRPSFVLVKRKHDGVRNRLVHQVSVSGIVLVFRRLLSQRSKATAGNVPGKAGDKGGERLLKNKPPTGCSMQSETLCN